MARINAKNREHLALQLASRNGCGWWCFYCRAPFTETRRPTFDHYIPYRLWRTGRHRNLVLACGPCNTAKGDRLPYTVAVVLLRKVKHSPVWRAACQGRAAVAAAESALSNFVYPPGDYATFREDHQ